MKLYIVETYQLTIIIYLYLRSELDADGNLTQGNNNDLLRRIEHLLEDISASTHPLRVQHNERPESTSLPYGVNSNDALNGHAIGSYATSSSSVPFSSEIEQSQPNMAPIDADTVVPAKSRKSNGFLGVVWPAGGGRASGPSSSISPTSFYPVPWVSRKGSTGVLSSASPAVRTILSNGLSGSGSGTLVGPKSQSVASARHHRIGAEEVVLRSPIHLSNDYGWKRVENSRWNNLRGMWGKRGIETKNVFSANKFKGFAEVPTNKVHNGQPNRL